MNVFKLVIGVNGFLGLYVICQFVVDCVLQKGEVCVMV